MLIDTTKELDSLRKYIIEQEKMLIDRFEGKKQLVQGRIVIKEYPNPLHRGEVF